MSLVVDASAVVAALTDGGPDGIWARAEIESQPLVAPHLMPVESANVLRRAVLAEHLSNDVASLAHEDLLGLTVEFVAYAPFAARAWELRANVTAYDAWYVAVAEALQLDLVTLDRRIRRAPDLRCEVRCPPA